MTAKMPDTLEMKLAVAAMLTAGATQADIADAYGASQPTVCRFIAKHLEQVWQVRPVNPSWPIVGTYGGRWTP